MISNSAIKSYFPIIISEYPFEFSTVIGNQTFSLRFKNNQRHGFITADLIDSKGQILIAGEPVILNQVLFEKITNPNKPIVRIVPMDESGNETSITTDNFGKTVQLFLDD